MRVASLVHLLRIVRAARRLIRPFAIELVPALLESLSALEPQALQYLQLHSERLELGTEKLEASRVAISQSGPVQEVLQLCLDQVCARMLIFTNP